MLLLINASCVTNYYTVLLEEDTLLYKSKSINSHIESSVPKGSTVYISAKIKKKAFRRIKWGNYYGWAYYTKYKNKTSKNTTTSYKPSPVYKSNSQYKKRSTGGTVNVRGYYRKDGTYVRPHTRSAPKKRY